MITFTDVLLRIKALILHSRAERELAEELQAHLEIETACRMRAGASHEEAERAARLAFGSDLRAVEACRDARGITWVEDFSKDLRYAYRQCLKQSGFFAVATLTLALGIGATTAMFSVVNGVLLRPLPYRNPERLANVWSAIPSGSIPGTLRLASARLSQRQPTGVALYVFSD